MCPKRYEEIKIRNKRVNKFLWGLIAVVALGLLIFKGIWYTVGLISFFIILEFNKKPLERWIEERELEIEWLKLKIEYLEDPNSFSKRDILAHSLYLNDCYGNNSELISDISKHSSMPNERHSKWLHKDWLYRFLHI